MRVLGKLATGLVLLAHPLSTPAQKPPPTPDQARFRALYQELVETDTSATTGSCTELADKVAGHLRQAGYGDDQITMFSVPEYPKGGGLVVFLPGTSKTLKPLLLLLCMTWSKIPTSQWKKSVMSLAKASLTLLTVLANSKISL